MKYQVKAQYPIYWTKLFTIEADDIEAAKAKCLAQANSPESRQLKFTEQGASPIKMGWEIVETDVVDRIECPQCRKETWDDEIQQRYSVGVYAGTFCEECCNSYIDRCGLDGWQASPNDIDEPYYEEEY